ncbi:type III pantothenate kinase [Bernardetia sp. OM2101]|uniref:type III pantothenate kinase n=1 Tax=Bernardetia sp. OM2101 TaxID=3344876 RepID=UPI0035CF1698
MFLLAIDFGNTTLKAALFENEVLLKVRYSLSIIHLDNWIDEIRNSKQLEGIIISSVRKNEETEFSFIESLKKKIVSSTRNNFDNSKLIIKSNSESKKFATDSKGSSVVVVLDETTPLPIQNNYLTPKTLGKDRLAAVIGAYFLEKETIKQPTLVIDAGTCITFDFINTKSKIKGVYEGGSISLGLQMRFKALNHFTAKLPLFEPNETLPTPIGASTQEAMQSGVQFGLISEIKGIIDFYQHQITLNNKGTNTKLNIVVCGGDAQILKKWWEEYVINFTTNSHIYPKWTIEPNLVLIGLQRIFQFIKNNEDN